MNKGVSNRQAAFLWFGAAVSVAEILTGTWLAPLGWQQGLFAILCGHIIGGLLFFGAGYIGAKTNQTAMQSVRLSFGEKGSMIFSFANLLQLLGWTAIMIFSGAEISNALSQSFWAGENFNLWAIIIGVLIMLWLAFGSVQIGKLKQFSLFSMFVIALWLSWRLYQAEASPNALAGELSFGTGVELAAVMPLSWLPLVADYTSNSKQPFKLALTSTLAYSFTSCWMYALGLGASIFFAQSDIAQILLLAGLGLAGLLIVVLSTVSTTYLDAYSAGASANNISAHLPAKPVAIGVSLVGTLLAITLPVTEYENFLLWIGSIFAPMIAVLLADFFLFKTKLVPKKFDWLGLSLWLAGFVLYRLLLANQWETWLGLTFPVMLSTFSLSILLRKLSLK